MIERAIAVCVAARQAALLADEAGEGLARLRRLPAAIGSRRSKPLMTRKRSKPRGCGSPRMTRLQEAIGLAPSVSPLAARPGGAFDVREEADSCFSGASGP